MNLRFHYLGGAGGFILYTLNFLNGTLTDPEKVKALREDVHVVILSLSQTHYRNQLKPFEKYLIYTSPVVHNYRYPDYGPKIQTLIYKF